MGAEFRYVSEFTLTMLYIKISVRTVAAFSAKESMKFVGLKTLRCQTKTVPRAAISSLILEICLWAGRQKELEELFVVDP